MPNEAITNLEQGTRIKDFLNSYVPEDTKGNSKKAILRALSNNEINNISDLRKKTNDFTDYSTLRIAGLGDITTSIIVKTCDHYLAANEMAGLDKLSPEELKTHNDNKGVLQFLKEYADVGNDAGFINKTSNVLKRNNIHTVSDLETATEGFTNFNSKQLKTATDLGSKGIGIIQSACEKYQGRHTPQAFSLDERFSADTKQTLGKYTLQINKEKAHGNNGFEKH